MREIKFRFRNKNNGKLEYFCLDELLWENGPRENIDWSNGQQFTGPHDKMGEEVWEGDILRTPGDQILVVNVTDLIWGDSKFHAIGIENCEKIGNIYENRELYKEAP